MIAAILYFLIIIYLIYRNGFFGIIKDKHISSFQFILLFTFKCLAIPTFYWVYNHYYGGLKNFDAGKFFDDSKVIQSIAFEHPFDYFKLLFGFQEDGEESFLYENYIKHTANWDEGTSYRLFFNDNKTVIRFHSLVHFISFHNYFTHALVSCLLGFIGIIFIYRSLKPFFNKYEKWVLLVFVLLPNLWLFSGALLKEPLILFQMGMSCFFVNSFFERNNSSFKKALHFVFLILIASILKPQIIIPFVIIYILFRLCFNLPVAKKGLIYTIGLVLIFVLINFLFVPIKHMSMISFINKKQVEFYDMMKGGIFLKDDHQFIRLPYDTSLIIRGLVNRNENIRIKQGTTYTYWEHTHQKDTLFCKANTDTTALYSLVYSLVPANTAYEIQPLVFNAGFFKVAAHAIYRTLFSPIKFNSLLNAVVSFENMFYIICFMISVVGFVVVKDRLPLLYFMSMVFIFMLVFGIATPNVGAIVRYRSVITPFLVLSAIYTLIKYYDSRKISKRVN